MDLDRWAKFLLFLVALPFLLVFFVGLVLPLLLLLLVFYLFIPSIRPISFFRSSPGSRQRRRESAEAKPRPDDTVLDVECTVVDTTEDDPDHSAGAGQLAEPEGKAKEQSEA